MFGESALGKYIYVFGEYMFGKYMFGEYVLEK